jgi:hypothetical protein
MEGKKSFVLYTDQREVFEELDDEQAGKLIKHIFSYVNDENPEADDKFVRLAFLPIKTQLKRDLKIWDEKKHSRVEAGKKGGLAKASNARIDLANHSNARNSLANVAVNVNGNVNDNVNVNGNVNDNVNVNGNVNKQISAGALFSLEEVFIDFKKEKPLKRPYIERMAHVHSTDNATVEKLFEKWAVLKEGESMTIAKAENSFNLYLANNLKSSYKPPEKSKTYNVFDELYEDLQKQKHQNNE